MIFTEVLESDGIVWFIVSSVCGLFGSINVLSAFEFNMIHKFQQRFLMNGLNELEKVIFL